MNCAVGVQWTPKCMYRQFQVKSPHFSSHFAWCLFCCWWRIWCAPFSFGPPFIYFGLLDHLDAWRGARLFSMRPESKDAWLTAQEFSQVNTSPTSFVCLLHFPSIGLSMSMFEDAWNVSLSVCAFV